MSAGAAALCTNSEFAPPAFRDRRHRALPMSALPELTAENHQRNSKKESAKHCLPVLTAEMPPMLKPCETLSGISPERHADALCRPPAACAGG